ncbi:MAG: MauE/DoxX family redox-associated membrane protein [Chthoniobacterales bacterium]
MSDVRHVQSPLMGGLRGAPPLRRFSPWRLALSAAVGVVFIYAGVLKALDPVKFASDIQNFHLLSYPLAVRLAFYLPWLEIICGLGLIGGWLREGATAILTGLTVIFILATVAAKVRGINLDCGCFGSATKNLTFTWHLVIDFALLGALLGVHFWPDRRLQRG